MIDTLNNPCFEEKNSYLYGAIVWQIFRYFALFSYDKFFPLLLVYESNFWKKDGQLELFDRLLKLYNIKTSPKEGFSTKISILLEVPY